MQKRVIALFAASLFMAACSPETKTEFIDGQDDTEIIDAEKTYTLQGTVMDAVTGQHLGGRDLDLYLIQGNEVRRPTRLETDVDEPLVGEYAFTKIPADYVSGSTTFKIVAIKEGYQRFEATLSFSLGHIDYNDDTIVDAVLNKVGNIYLFPVAYQAPDYTFHVVFNGKPVPGAVVQLQPVVTDSLATAELGSPISASSGYASALSTTTDAQGVATFAGTSLALGVAYQAVVFPIAFEGVQLSQLFAGELMVGMTDNDNILPMSELSPGSNPYGLYVKAISNSVDDQVDATGTLVISFNRPVVLNTTTSAHFGAYLDGGSSGVLDATNPVVTELSQDGLTLTLRPRFTTNPAANDRGTSIVYTDGGATVSVSGYPASAFPVFGLYTAEHDVIDGRVYLTAP